MHDCWLTYAHRYADKGRQLNGYIRKNQMVSGKLLSRSDGTNSSDRANGVKHSRRRNEDEGHPASPLY